MLIEQLFKEMLILHEEFAYRKFNIKSLWYFYNCYNLAIVSLGHQDKDKEKKNKLWKKLLINISNGVNISEEYSKLISYIPGDMAIVHEALKEITKDKIKLGQDQGNFWKQGYLALPVHEIE